MSALFTPEGDDLFLPGPRARGPWDANALHGGPVAALLTRVVEQLPAEGEMQLARITVELLRPAPVAPLRATSGVLRPGRKLQLLGASLWAGETEVARAVAVRIRSAAVDMPDLQADAAGDPPPPLPRTQAKQRRPGDWDAFHNEGVEMRFVSGYFGDPGPAVVWMRLCQPVVAGEEPTQT
ncbi:MAG TPA: acyl-CoA thioesterase domain-containing protein, partial [Acidimicrobiales bacterium]|nr:acyl-CoA thioesterase domain-containing protein [Acidimicrobiales bacterium]